MAAAGRVGPGGRGRRHQRSSPVGAGPVQQRGAGGSIADHGGAQASVERGRHGELVAGIDLELVGERVGAAGSGGLPAQELVDRRQLAADSGGLPPRGLDRPLGIAHGATCPLDASFGLLALAPRPLGVGLVPFNRGARFRQLALERGELAGQLGLAVAIERRQSVLEICDSSLRLGVGDIGVSLGRERVESAAVVLEAAIDRGRRRADRVGPVGDALAGRLGGKATPRELLALGAAAGQRLLGGLPALANPLQLALDLLGARAGLCRLGPRLRQRRALRAKVVASELPAGLQRLALEPSVQVRRFGLALERAQSRARLALDVERAVEVVLGAHELELGPPAALAVLAQARRLLDQQPAVAGLGGDDRLDPALRDHRVHLLAQPRVRQHLDHVHQAATRAGEAVLALSRPIEPP